MQWLLCDRGERSGVDVVTVESEIASAGNERASKNAICWMHAQATLLSVSLIFCLFMF